MARFSFKRLLTLSLILGIMVLLGSQPIAVDAQAGNPNAYGSDVNAPNNAVFVTAAGNVGVGTQDPGSRLMARTDAGGTTNNILSFATYADTGKGSHFGIDTVNRMMYWRITDAYDYGWQFQTNYGEHARMTITKDGNVGIGTTSPDRELTIAKTGAAYLNLKDGTTEIVLGTNTQQGGIIQTSHDLELHPGGNMLVLGNGNVGIGIAHPDRELTIAKTGAAYLNLKDGTTEIVLGTNTQQGGIIQTSHDLELHPGGNMLLLGNGNVGIGMVHPQAKLDVNGTTSTKVLQITGGSDLAEPFEIVGADDIQPGMVVAIDPDNPGQLRLATAAYDRTVAGVVSGAGGINPGLVMQQEGSLVAGSHPVALTGRVYVWADASNGTIVPGDLLTTSATPGYAMKVIDYERAQGAILGKAMSKLEEGTGLVLVLVTLQ